MTLHLPGIEPNSGADISPCGLFRYKLWRTWNPDLPVLVVCMLNPSVADASKNDPTVRRCIGFARAWGYGGLVVINLFALRATDPKDLLSAEDPVGSYNDLTIQNIAKKYGSVLVAWGATGRKQARVDYVLDLFRQEGVDVYCLGKTKHGHPMHPLYVSGEKQRELYMEPDLPTEMDPTAELRELGDDEPDEGPEGSGSIRA